jgi:16S rRNA (guanine(966)-N(2))-methyltransferase RsmD
MKQVKLKIIAGTLKGKTLISMSEDTKETASLVRGAVFNMLFQVDGTVLDLFAGSGAYGFEAYSRGATKIYLNDHHPLALKSLKLNESKLNTGAVITSMDYLVAIRYYERHQIQFDYIFLDPPYALTINPILNAVTPLIKTEGKIIIEIESSNPCPVVDGLTLIKDRVHGIKRIGIYEKTTQGMV